ncbi:MAG: sensor histidine kinase [Faecalibacterium sp.]|jgi:two-component system sensor histidine kinase YesM|nr:sensor histidine kinase [Faecalibacterium sp.]
MKSNPQKAKTRRSLRASLIMMVFLSWVLPVVVSVGAAGWYLFSSLTEQAGSTLHVNAQSALELVDTRLAGAVASSRKASYIPTIRNAWRQYQQDGNRVVLYDSVSQMLYQQYKYDEKFLNTIVTFDALPEDSIYVTNTTSGGTTEGIRKYDRFIRPQALALSAELGTSVAFLEQEGHLFMVRNLVDADYRPFAVIVMELNSEQVFREITELPGAESAVLSLNGAQLCLCGTPLPCRLQDISAGVSVCIQADGLQASLAVSAKRVQADYTVCFSAVTVPPGLRQQKAFALFTLALVALFTLPLMALILRFLTSKVNRPVQALMDAADAITAGHFGTEVDTAALTSREMETLGENFNHMSRTLQNQFEHIYKEELALRDARIMALQSQINPHFLNNTLEIINWEARLNGDLKVCRMMESLSTMLCAAMDRKHRPLVHLSEELMYVDAYLYIINERLGKRLTVIRAIDDSLLDAYVPRLILQPILENAVEHGITPTQKGTIALRAYRQTHWMVLEVENDGLTTPEDLEKIRALLTDDPAPADERSASLGIRNVHQRLRILYGAESGLSVNITKNNCTLFSMKINLSQSGQD